ncbi:hypothetical protein [uncultured Microbacterium sp.]|uniref:hypothetical protein n=1 Tax=uncultured Microbacterium sp. TaxID=191216 RepID=UPI0025DA7758|nr:hypothetical protein [uncultured Microbacterium sp.]
MTVPSRRLRYAHALRRLRPFLSWLVSLVSLVVILAVLRAAGVPLSLPGVVIVLGLLLASRAMIGRSRRRRRRRDVTSPNRSR